MNNLITTAQLKKEDILNLFERADELKKKAHSHELAHKKIFLAFFEPSTRTRLSFEIAAKNLGAHVVDFNADSSSMLKGESVLDTLRTVQAMGIDTAVVRHKENGITAYLQSNLKVPIINAGDGTNEHPTQALLDAYTIRNKVGDTRGKRITIVGDIVHSRVAGSNFDVLHKLGFKIALLAPPEFLPKTKLNVPFKIHDSIETAFAESDIVMALRIQKERMESALIPDFLGYRKKYGITVQLAEKYKDVLIMHPGPVTYGVEIDEVLVNYKNCLINKQVAAGVHIRMAILSMINGS